ncbi:hypothetical protein GUITHDRAFT_100288 [Guillardia theta CCMP2712]|uniref:Uncharacterized protein n=1 Tax=Guillardia theta (strain CCMP2712) TaxID=905079 RepID=L1K086_GUITC|nr:hypothetical protein GUITHDRAFT_100288 [Guillardia theta CCMP2712]EKX54037.1 hypothetical protein GUITHDRAFT_100288 [Guillardia theta CCMP2712]|eukprot:XP_005841017.1 hypothetical protein GUITHDRAFT_100288 [Guillardia theta CCMP2712]
MALVGRRQPLLLLVGRGLKEAWRIKTADAAYGKSEGGRNTWISHARSFSSKSPKPQSILRPQLSFDALQKKADEGDVQSMFLLGSAYLKGQLGAKKDYDKARMRFEQAAEHEHKQALFNLGVMYLEGQGVTADAPRARLSTTSATATMLALEWIRTRRQRWSRQAPDREARQGDHKACLRLALAYISGDGVNQDSQAARQILQRPAFDGNAEAQFLLGYLLLNIEEASEQNIKDASFNLESASSKGFIAAKHYLGMCLLKGHRLEADMSRASSLLQEAALAGHGQSAYELHKMYKEGKNLDAESRKWLERAAELGVKEALTE